jgi:uncharacterized YkwD family protein
MFKNRLSIYAVSAAALIATMAMAAPASAATCPTTTQSYTTQYRLVRSHKHHWWFQVILVQVPTTTTAPTTTAKAPVTPVTTKATTTQAPVTQAPVAKAPTAPAPAPVKPVTTAPATNTANGVSMTAAEQQMLNLINGVRAQNGLQPLKADAQLTKTARLKSQDMINLNYFSHQSPTYGSPFDMMNKFGISYKTAGENIAGNGSVEGAFQAWMNSPGHRANILNGQYNYTGIGIVSGGQYGMMFTQQFVGR